MLTDKKYAGNINQRKGINLKEKRMILRTRLPNVKDTKRRRKSTSSNGSKNRWGPVFEGNELYGKNGFENLFHSFFFVLRIETYAYSDDVAMEGKPNTW